MAWDRRVPVCDKTGSLLHYPEFYHKYTWVPVDHFCLLDGSKEVELIFNRFDRGRSSVVAWFNLTNVDRFLDREFPMSLSDFEDVLYLLKDLRLPKMKYTASKKGNNYFIKPVK